MIMDETNYLAHYGILRKSGRYPWGSGGTVVARSRSFLGTTENLRKQGMTDVEIARGFGMTTTQLRALRSIANNEDKQANINLAQRLKDKGMSNIAIGKRMGNINESSVRSLLAAGLKDEQDILKTTSSMLKNQVDTKGYIDVGAGVEYHIGVSRNKLDTSIAVLKEQGYELHNIQLPALGTNFKTTYKILAPPGTKYVDIVKNTDKIRQITESSDDGGRNFFGTQPPLSVDSKRVAIRYADQGGAKADGVIYVRPGVDDVSIGSSRYAQVRIAVDGSHYLKGMAVYKDDLPAGVDLLFNTNKKDTGNKYDAMKPLKKDKEGIIDPDNPFGAIIHQLPKLDEHGNAIPNTVRSSMNIVGKNPGAGEEGNWETWSNNLSSQFLSKQSPALARQQLDMKYERNKMQFDEIMTLTNPAVRKTLLDAFADTADYSAIHLEAAALPRQSTHVILPLDTLKDTEIYAPNYRNGERVVLIRHPHGGPFEIPELTVNNNHPDARKTLGTNLKDAVGINSTVAERLSGADFDGDSVLVIPQGRGKGIVKTASPLAGLKDFDPKASYPEYPGMKVMTSSIKQAEMGKISNLITDMTIRRANNAELARAVRHSMVVIDAEKHNLDYKQSALDNGILQLKQKYQGGSTAGASTLISRATSRQDVPLRKPRSAAKGGPIDKATGKLVFEETGKTFVNSKGKIVVESQRSTKLAETDDAHTLSSGTVMETIYADHSNKLKALANQARKASVLTRGTPYSPSAKTAYSKEVSSLNGKLHLALRNQPLERQAQVIGNSIVSIKKQADPNMDGTELKRVKAQALEEARTRTGAKKTLVNITQSEWDAIQAGAITNSKLEQILRNSDLEQVKKLATPRTNLVMTPTKQARAKTMLASGYTQAEVADALGVALSTLKSSVVNGG